MVDSFALCVCLLRVVQTIVIKVIELNAVRCILCRLMSSVGFRYVCYVICFVCIPINFVHDFSSSIFSL